MRNFEAPIAAELSKETLRYFFMLELQLDTTFRWNDIDIDIYDDAGNRFTPRGFSFGDIAGSSAMAVESVDIEVDDTDQGISAVLLNEDVRNKPAIIHFGVITPDIVNHQSVYPPAHDDAHVKATSSYAENWSPFFATDPEKSLIGPSDYKAWISSAGADTNQRFHIDLGTAKIVSRIYYENFSYADYPSTGRGVRNFTLWGSNSPAAFAELTYGMDAGWTQLATDRSQFEQHVAADIADPEYILVANAAPYRYYAFKFADNHIGGSIWMGVRRIELQASIGRSKIHSQEFLRGIIGGWELSDDNKARITITNELVLWKKKSLRIQQSSCPWAFKGLECGYAGSGAPCDQSYDRCAALSNTDHFGGDRFLPAIMEKELWWGRSQAI